MEVKKCPRCNRTKKVHLFSKNVANADGLQVYCKSCSEKYRKERINNLTDSEKLKRKAQRYRSNWISRSRKIDKLNDPELEKPTLERSVPSSTEINNWLIKKQPFRCYISGSYLKIEDFEIDHIIPTSRGGNFCFNNLDIISPKWNRIKGSLTAEELFKLLDVISTWEDKGEHLLRRLSQANY